MRSTAAFGRLAQFHLKPGRDVGRATQRPDSPGHASRNELNQPAQRQRKFRSDPFACFEHSSKPVPLGSRALELLIALVGFAALRLATAANPTWLRVTTRRPLAVTEVAFPVLVSDHERPSPDGATQGSSA
jgi:hypothetical protein